MSVKSNKVKLESDVVPAFVPDTPTELAGNMYNLSGSSKLSGLLYILTTLASCHITVIACVLSETK